MKRLVKRPPPPVPRLEQAMRRCGNCDGIFALRTGDERTCDGCRDAEANALRAIQRRDLHGVR